MKQVYESLEGKDFEIVAVDIGEDRDKVAAYIAKGEYPFHVLLDSDKSVSKAYRVTSIPVSVFVDREGRIAYRKLGTMKEDEMRSVLESLVE
ncbi:TlpA family protein disulfide reductase [Cohnella rhizosphaerae]|uniref:TlpA family protein disulfide reductase n=1 Tax=Cohnella rhizosphaerae TaxID=1457232 RepID=A0A9X4KWK9_9BACL|nr:TlpA disulfide reductase family protein [Cohnella rhizosphaerae]MDG0811853.1 TlpA family protein disulfide reductase [Cohnella rhizosphaerae]